MSRVVVAALLAGLLTACGTVSGEQAGTALSGAVSPEPIAASHAFALPADCDRGRPPSTGVVYEPVTVNAAGSDVTVCDAAGGWRMVVPQRWFERPWRQHGREVMSYDPAGMDNSGAIPGPGQILVRLQMYQNPTLLSPSDFAATTPIGVIRPMIRDHRQVTIAGQMADFYEVNNVSRPSPDWPETTLYWYLRSPFFADRIVVVSLARPESALRAEGERIVASLRFFQPAPVSFIPKVSRAEAIARVTSRSDFALTRVEAKLVLRKELEATKQFGTDWYTDPDALTWVVVYAGDGIYPHVGSIPFRPNGTPAPPAPTLGPCVSGYVIFPADGEAGSQIGPGCDSRSRSSWPAWFDSLIDHGS